MPPTRESGQFAPNHFKPGTVRGAPGFFRVGCAPDGRWWLIGPHDRPVFLRAVGAVNRHAAGRRRVAVPPEFAPPAGGEPNAFARETGRRLLGWGFNALGIGSDPDLAGLGGLHHVGLVDFLHAGGPVIRAHGVVLPDVFDTAWPAFCDARAKLAAACWRGRTGLVGLHTDADIVWASPASAGGLGLLQICLGLEPVHAAHHAAWEFALAPHSGDLAALGRAWGMALPHRETIRQLTHAERPLAHPAHRADDQRFTREFARRYFQTTVGALRRHDPGHLVLGVRFASPPPAAVLAESGPALVDLLALPAGDLPPGQPRLLIDVGLPEGTARPADLTSPRAGPTRLERRLAGLRRQIGTATVNPLVVGYEWARWSDEAGDTPPFAPGLVHLDGAEAREHTELVTPLNIGAEARRRRARPVT
ncbi:MAG: hypothetical protein ABII82_05300 [Verrucomicrobiota bacterium]